MLHTGCRDTVSRDAETKAEGENDGIQTCIPRVKMDTGALTVCSNLRTQRGASYREMQEIQLQRFKRAVRARHVLDEGCA